MRSYLSGRYGIVRFHGRNKETWEAKGLRSAAQRFNYYYKQGELEEWVPKIQMMAQESISVNAN